MGLDTWKAGLDAENVILKKEPLDSAQVEMLCLLLVPDLPGKWENMSGRH